jgi:hypothetical protein
MSKFKIGDRVRIKENSEQDICHYSGMVGTVTSSHDNVYAIVDINGGSAWLWNIEESEIEYEDDSLDLAIWGAGLNLSSLDEVMREEEEKAIERAFDEPVNKLRSRIEELERAIRAMCACLATDDPLYDLHMRIADKALGREYE